jgi:hypothetical protein
LSSRGHQGQLLFLNKKKKGLRVVPADADARWNLAGDGDFAA